MEIEPEWWTNPHYQHQSHVANTAEKSALIGKDCVNIGLSKCVVTIITSHLCAQLLSFSLCLFSRTSPQTFTQGKLI